MNSLFWVIRHSGTGFMFGAEGTPTTDINQAAKYASIAEVLAAVRINPQWDIMSFAPDQLAQYDFTPQLVDTIQ